MYLMTPLSFKWLVLLFVALIESATMSIAVAEDTEFSVLYTFNVANAATGASPSGSQPDTRPVLGRDHAIYGMTYTGGANGTGVIYRYDRHSHEYTVLHTFEALDANGTNEDGANPGVALTRGPDDVFYGMASFGGKYGTGTVFRITSSGEFTLLHTFSGLDLNLHNSDGANPLRAIVVGNDGSLYGTTRLGGEYTCGPKESGCGVAWVMTQWGSFSVLHQFKPDEGHAASLLEARDGYFYGCAVFPFAGAGSGILYRMTPSGKHFEVLYRFTPVDADGNNPEGADCYEPLVETEPGVFYGAATYGGPNANGVIFRYWLEKGGDLDVVHAFSATNAIGGNWDGAMTEARLNQGRDGWLYSTASFGGQFGSGTVFRLRGDGQYQVLHTFSGVNPTTGGNVDGAEPDFGVLIDHDRLIGMSDYGGHGSAAGVTGNGTLYELMLNDECSLKEEATP
jgi:uncharacterized repeat protein (TIGR03803 family)